MARLAHHFEEGGWGMYPILVCSIVAVTIALTRVATLFSPRPSATRLVERIERSLAAGDVSGALFECAHAPSAAGRIIHAGLRESLQQVARIEGAVAQALLLEEQPLRRWHGGLWSITQLATLFGLYGTITGLHTGFGAPNADATSRACMLARGISESMNCTAFGLFVSMFALTTAWISDGRAKELRDELVWVAAVTRNRLVHERHVLLWHGARPSVAPRSYRAIR